MSKDTLKWQEVKPIVLKTTFLPIGFPEKTPHGYLSFSYGRVNKTYPQNRLWKLMLWIVGASWLRSHWSYQVALKFNFDRLKMFDYFPYQHTPQHNQTLMRTPYSFMPKRVDPWIIAHCQIHHHLHKIHCKPTFQVFVSSPSSSGIIVDRFNLFSSSSALLLHIIISFHLLEPSLHWARTI
jgi:hypothetical protein